MASLHPISRRASQPDHQIPVFAAAAQELRGRTALDAAEVMATIGEVVYDWNIETDHLTWGSNAAAIFSALPRPVPNSGVAFASLVDGNGRSRFDAVFGSREKDSGDGVPFATRYALQQPQHGETCLVEDRGRWFAGEDGRPRRAQGVVRVQPDARAAAPVAAPADDSAIPVLSREALLARITAHYRETPEADPQLGLLLVSIRDLPALRRSCGSAVAEEIVAATAARLRAHIRRSDTVLRWPEYGCAILLRRCGSEQTAIVAKRLMELVARSPVETAVGRLDIALVAGAAASAATAPGAAALLRGAEDALDQAGDTPDQPFASFAAGSGLETASERVRDVARTIVAALEESRVRLALQPIVDARSHAVFCHEALARIGTADGKGLAPDQFFPVAERSGLVKRIDRRVLELALAHLRANPEHTLTVNVSPTSAHDPDWKAVAIGTVADNPDVASRLIVEITEQAAMGDMGATKALIAGLKRHGVRVAMDDFGAGHTSFRNLRELAFDIVKIDGTFIRDLSRSADDGYFVRTLLDLSRHLGIKTIAEWVEDEATATLLTDWGADYLQGYFFGKAV